MRWVRLSPLIIATFFLLTGCDFFSNPTDLIKPPEIEISQKEIKEAIENFLPEDSQLTIPIHQDEEGAFILKDIDNDGVDEIIVFYKKEKTMYELGILILEKKESDWGLKDNIEEISKDIDYVIFADLTGDKILELLVGWSGGEGLNKDLSIYKLNKNEYEIMKKVTYNDFSVGDIDKDGVSEIAIISQLEENEIPTTELKLYKYIDDHLNVVSKKTYDGYPDSVLVGNASENKKGIFVDIFVGAHSGYTQLAIFEDGVLKDTFKKDDDDFPITFKPYPLPSKDINNDGIIEIGIKVEPPGSEGLAMVEIPWLESWNIWDQESGIIEVMQSYSDYSYSNYNEGYQFKIPSRWINNFTIKKDVDKNFETNFVNFYTINDKGEAKRLLLSIYHIPKDAWKQKEKELNADNVEVIVLGENISKILAGVLPKEDKSVKTIDKEELLKNFTIIQ